MQENREEIAHSDEKEYQTSDQGYAAYLATKFMFLGAVDSDEEIPSHQSGKPKLTRKYFLFLVPASEDMDEHILAYSQGSEQTRVPAKVMFSKTRLMRQACRQVTVR